MRSYFYIYGIVAFTDVYRLTSKLCIDQMVVAAMQPSDSSLAARRKLYSSTATDLWPHRDNCLIEQTKFNAFLLYSSHFLLRCVTKSAMFRGKSEIDQWLCSIHSRHLGKKKLPKSQSRKCLPHSAARTRMISEQWELIEYHWIRNTVGSCGSDEITMMTLHIV